MMKRIFLGTMIFATIGLFACTMEVPETDTTEATQTEYTKDMGPQPTEDESTDETETESETITVVEIDETENITEAETEHYMYLCVSDDINGYITAHFNGYDLSLSITNESAFFEGYLSNGNYTNVRFTREKGMELIDILKTAGVYDYHKQYVNEDGIFVDEYIKENTVSIYMNNLQSTYVLSDEDYKSVCDKMLEYQAAADRYYESLTD